MCKSLTLVLCLLFQIILKGQGKHLAFFQGPTTWLKANRTCSECGGELVDWNESLSEIVSLNNLQNKIVWIGDYTVKNPWIVVKGCVSESDLANLGYNVIYNNNPYFCSRTCSAEQMFVLKGQYCYCIDTDVDICDKHCVPYCVDGYIKVYAIENVYSCNFEQNSCKNTSFGREVTGLVWKITEDNGHYGIGQIGRKKDHYLLLQYLTANIKNKARLSIRLNLPNTYFCFSFKYYMFNGGSLEIFITGNNGERFIAWKKYGNKGHMWYSSSLDIKGHRDLKIEAYGSIDNLNSRIAIDDMKLLPGSCNKEKWLDCNFDDSSCEWQQGSNWQLEYYNHYDDYVLATNDNDEKFNLRSVDIRRYISKTNCLRFQYIISKRQGSLKVNVNQTAIFTHKSSNSKNTWGNMLQTFPAEGQYSINITGSTDGGYVEIDNISLRSGSCEQDKVPNADILLDLNTWEIEKGLVTSKCGENCLSFKNRRLTKGRPYNVTSPFIKITSSSMFCLHFNYLDYRREPGSISIALVVNGVYKQLWENSYKTQNRNQKYEKRLDFDAARDFKIVFQVIRKSDQYPYKDIKMEMLALMLGFCKKGTDEYANDMSMGPMCPVMNIGDNLRLSVGYCTKMKTQAYICKFEDKQYTKADSICQSDTEMIQNSDVFTKTSDTTSTPASSVAPTDHVAINSTNVPLFLKDSEGSTAEGGLAVIIGILSALVIFLVALVLWLYLKLKRHQTAYKERDKTTVTDAFQNTSYEMESITSSQLKFQNENNGASADYELASRTQKDKDLQNYNSNTKQDSHEPSYQNNGILTPPIKRESQVYQDMDEGAYDSLGDSADRRLDVSNKDGPTYDHAQKVKPQLNNIYDTTKLKSDDNYFILERENSVSHESAIYDHTD